MRAVRSCAVGERFGSQGAAVGFGFAMPIVVLATELGALVEAEDDARMADADSDTERLNDPDI